VKRNTAADAEPEPLPDSGDIAVRILTPEELVGAVEHEIRAQDGVITNLERVSDAVAIDAELPARAFRSLVEAVRELSQGRVILERS